jgi:hypothetical protein
MTEPTTHTADIRDQTTDVRDTPSPDNSFAELVGKLTEDTSRLFRQELELARAEVKHEAIVAATAAAMMAAAGALAAVSLILLSFAAVEGLQRLLDIDIAWCYLIVGVLWAAIAGVLFAMGRRKLQQVNPTPERTVETVKEIPSALKGQS